MIREVAPDTYVEVMRERRSAQSVRAADAIQDAHRHIKAAMALWRRAQSDLRSLGDHPPRILIEDAAQFGNAVQLLANGVYDACAARGFGAVDTPVREVVSNG